MGVNMSIPAAYDECLSQTEQLEWLYKHKENLLTAGANIRITRSGDTVVIAAEGEGFSPTVNVETIPGGHRVTITDGEGPHVFDVMDGENGQDGTDGTDGTSVTFATSSISGGTRVTLTDGEHSSHFDVMDGLDGEDITITDVSVISAGTQVTFSDDTVIVIPNGLTGPRGQAGENGRNVFIKYADEQPTQDSDMKDIPSAFMGVYSGTATTAPSTYTDYLWYQIKGTKGDRGSQGESGVSPSLSSEPISGGHRVSMTDAEGTTTFDVMDGENAAAATVTVGSTTTGEPGTNASVTNSGTSSDAVLDFVIPRGLQGPTGQTGSKGDKGDTGTTPAITMSATADATSSVTPSVTVTKTGTDEAPNFALAFSGLKGAAGAAGQGVPSGGTGNQVLAKVNATDYNTQWKTIEEVPAGGNNGDVLTKAASGPMWAAPTGGGSSKNTLLALKCDNGGSDSFSNYSANLYNSRGYMTPISGCSFASGSVNTYVRDTLKTLQAYNGAVMTQEGYAITPLGANFVATFSTSGVFNSSYNVVLGVESQSGWCVCKEDGTTDSPDFMNMLAGYGFCVIKHYQNNNLYESIVAPASFIYTNARATYTLDSSVLGNKQYSPSDKYEFTFYGLG